MKALALTKAPWYLQAIITALFGILVSGFAAWGGKVADHEKRLSVVEDHQKGIDKSLDEIKEMQRDQSRDTKEILKRLPPRLR
jgi:hypothetical protein